jgi:hypothetical protein
MYWVYALKSAQHNWIYVGMTSNIERRVEEHNRGRNTSCAILLPHHSHRIRPSVRFHHQYIMSTRQMLQ